MLSPRPHKKKIFFKRLLVWMQVTINFFKNFPIVMIGSMLMTIIQFRTWTSGSSTI